MENLRITDFPRTLQAVARLIGVNACFAINLFWADESLYIPRNISTKHLITLVIGQEAAGKISAVYGGTYLQIPKTRTVDLNCRNREILRQRMRVARVLALEYHLTERQIQSIFSAEFGRKPMRSKGR